MANLTPPSLVAGAARQAVPYGLFSLLDFRGEDEARWQGGGVSWEHLPCGDALEGIGAVQNPQSDTGGLPKELSEWADADLVGNATPFTVYSYSKTSPIGWTPEEAGSRSNALLQSQEQFKVEKIFWSGSLGNTPYLDIDVTPSFEVGSELPEILGLLEDTMTSTYVGAQGVIHMSRKNALILLGKGLMKTKNGVLMTELDTPVVAGGGYDSNTLRSSPALFGYRSDIFTSSNRPGDLLDKGSNDLYSVSERTYLIGFDPCPVIAVSTSQPS